MVSARRNFDYSDLESDTPVLRIMDSLPALIAYVDVDLRYRYNNRAYEAWFGVRREDLRGRPVEEVLGAAALAAVRPHLEAALRGEPSSFESVVDYERAGRRWVRADYVPDRTADGLVRGFFALVSDVTEMREAQEARKRDLTARLQAEEEREHLLVRLQEANRELAEAGRQKDRFLAVLAHELRNPLAVVSGAVKAASQDASRMPGLLEVLVRNVGLLERLVDNLQDFSRQVGGTDGEGPESPAGPEETPDCSGMRVLVIDDNRDAAMTMQCLLDLAGASVELAYDGPSGLELALARPPDAVVLDLALPRLPGHQVAAVLRARGFTGPIVVVSGNGSLEDRRKSMEAGVDLHLVKPADVQALLVYLSASRRPPA